MSNPANRGPQHQVPHAPHRASVSGTFPTAKARGLTEALLEALEQLEQARQATTHRENPDDDDEDPTRRAPGD